MLLWMSIHNVTKICGLSILMHGVISLSDIMMSYDKIFKFTVFNFIEGHAHIEYSMGCLHYMNY